MASRSTARRNPSRAAARTTIAVQGARVHNLKNISVEIPRDKLIVVTGLSGSGKSSLAFDTIYAEGQRRYMESLSSFAKRFVAQVAKPDVDFVFGLSPVISIEQKTIASNPRSTVGTMTDIASYLNLLFATIGEPHCPRTGEPTPSRTASQILEAILSLPEGTEIELRAPVFKVYGEELDFVLTEVRKKGCRRLIIDGKPVDISEQVELDESKVRHMDAVVDRLVVGRKHEKAIKAAIAATLLVGDGLLQVQVVKGAKQGGVRAVLPGAVQRDAPLRLRRHPARVLHVQQPGERLPDLRRPGGPQADAPGAAGARSQAEHPRRLLRARGVQVQPRHLGRTGDVQPGEGAAFLARYAVGEAPRAGAAGDPERHRPEDRARPAAGGEGKPRRLGGQGGRLRRDRPADRAALPPLPAEGRGKLGDGGLARQRDGRAHLPRLQRRAGQGHQAVLHHRRQDHPRRSASSTSTSSTRSWAPSSRPAAAPTPAGRCSRRSAAGSSCSWASDWTT